MKRSIFIILVLFTFGVNAQQKLRYFGQTTDSYTPQIAYGDNPKTGKYATASDGTKIYYEVYGKGKPIVILHGGLVGSIAEMGEFIDNLSKNHQVIAISTRGHGKSQIGNTPVSYDQRAEDVYQVIKATKEPVTIIGFSDGVILPFTLLCYILQKLAKW